MESVPLLFLIKARGMQCFIIIINIIYHTIAVKQIYYAFTIHSFCTFILYKCQHKNVCIPFCTFKNTLYSKGFLNFLKFYNTAYQIKTAHIDRLYNLLNENYHFMTKDKVLQIKSLASSSVSFHSVAIST